VSAEPRAASRELPGALPAIERADDELRFGIARDGQGISRDPRRIARDWRGISHDASRHRARWSKKAARCRMSSRRSRGPAPMPVLSDAPTISRDPLRSGDSSLRASGDGCRVARQISAAVCAARSPWRNDDATCRARLANAYSYTARSAPKLVLAHYAESLRPVCSNPNRVMAPITRRGHAYHQAVPKRP